jgi:hypothetical protein
MKRRIDGEIREQKGDWIIKVSEKEGKKNNTSQARSNLIKSGIYI